ncbi:MAG TPA: sulfotransferase [Thermoanaerobaculia bacterium]|nr:sulfotransferase [Thermoanaerobaculia bacterium]
MTGHLIHIGYPKTGSNFLRRWFRAHPQLTYADGSIAGFLNVYEIVKTGAALPSNARYRVTSAEGLATPQQSFGDTVADFDTPAPVPMDKAQAAACRMLGDLFPNATVLIVTRGFRAAILSMYSQLARNGSNLEFGAFCASLERSIPMREDGWDYDHLIGLYVAAFGPANVIVLPYELLRDDANAFTNTLADRLGVEHFAGSHERVNPSLSPEELYWYPRITRVVKSAVPRRLFRRYARAALNNNLRVPIRVLQRLRPGTPVTDAAIPHSLIDAFRGRADSLRDNPLYAQYASDYLFSSR